MVTVGKREKVKCVENANHARSDSVRNMEQNHLGPVHQGCPRGEREKCGKRGHHEEIWKRGERENVNNHDKA